ncbi:SH3 domain-containing protein [Oleiagrimonas sp. MCCC 1A03011]|uniref:SH3 domain-containing protein n=1 Tax=Oleiagrimonas sp. MCCC 1A03011 TaxID=1926883 RepID=UPI000DC5E94B|nr:SH3 domain-containing protein [Oleiagrimonas sp. MCCC 1A03011]RAP59135.1 hypothetical protein BTJ49_00110 [Oleiagrimonas sp. MCCC 1A03011]
MRRHAWLFAFTLLLALPAAAQATRAYADVTINMRAGPDIGYPIVDLVRAGTPLYVQGCTADWAWCDVIAYGHRGWVAGDFIRYPYHRRWVPIYGYGAVIGIPVIRFVIGDYWHRHYRHHRFYHQRNYWYRYRPRHYAPPRRHHRAPPRIVHRDRYYRVPQRRHDTRRHESPRIERRHIEHRRIEHRRIQRQHTPSRRLAPTVLHRGSNQYSGSRSHQRSKSHRAQRQASTRHNGSARRDNRHHGRRDRDHNQR